MTSRNRIYVPPRRRKNQPATGTSGKAARDTDGHSENTHRSKYAKSYAIEKHDLRTYKITTLLRMHFSRKYKLFHHIQRQTTIPYTTIQRIDKRDKKG